MAKHFIFGVMTAEIRKGNQVLATAKTMVDTSLGFTVESTEIRAGSGNKLLGKIYHSAGLSLSLTDVCFKMQYLALNLGVDVTLGAECYTTEKVVLGANGVGTIKGKPLMIDGAYLGFAQYVGEETKYTVVMTGNDNEFVMPNGNEGDVVCVEYKYKNDAAKQIKVPVDVVPAIVEIVGWIDLYTGESKEKATKVGKVEIEIPKFQFNGNMDLSLTASGQCNIPLSGNALASDEVADCEDGENGFYALIKEIPFDGHWYDTLIGLTVAGGDLEVLTSETETLTVVGSHSDGIANTECDNANLTFTSDAPSVALVTDQGVVEGVSAGNATITITCKDKPKIKTTVNVEVTTN